MMSGYREMVEFFPASDVVQRMLREIDELSVEDLMDRACALWTEGHGNLISFSPKVFIPLTRLCRDVCGYCTFAHSPRQGERAFLTMDEVLVIARAGVAVAAPKRCSRSANCRSSVTASRAMNSSASATPVRSIIWWKPADRCLSRPGCCRMSIPASCRPMKWPGCDALALPRALCWRVPRCVSCRKADRITGPWARCRKCGLRCLPRPVGLRSPSQQEFPDRDRRDARGSHRVPARDQGAA